MNISSESGSRLCDSVVQALCQWVAFQPALQGVGFERSSQGTLERVISEWLDPRFAVLPEYKRRGFLRAQHHGARDLGASPCESSEPAMGDGNAVPGLGSVDFAVFLRSVPMPPCLPIATVIEVKFNYAGQSEVSARLVAGARQVAGYAHMCAAQAGYVLYLLADTDASIALPDAASNIDVGWQYLRRSVFKLPTARKRLLDSIPMAVHQGFQLRDCGYAWARKQGFGISCSLFGVTPRGDVA